MKLFPMLAVILGCLACAAGLFFLMESLIPPAPVPPPPAIASYDPRDPTPREPALPVGPHQDEFTYNCIACHSARLVMTQPSFSEKQWAAVVNKMTKMYGAQMTPELEAQIVKYLVATKGVK